MNSSLILDNALKILGTGGYALLIDHGIETARCFAEEIRKRPLFQLITEPELNILTCRICPPAVLKRLIEGTVEEIKTLNTRLNGINRSVQRIQRETGRSFVSRTMLKMGVTNGGDLVVFRAVIIRFIDHKFQVTEKAVSQESIDP